jgi:hypothetical protein
MTRDGQIVWTAAHGKIPQWVEILDLTTDSDEFRKPSRFPFRIRRAYNPK